MDGATDDACVDYAVVEEADELQDLVEKVVQSGGQRAGSVHDRYKQILTKYQEQPQLLDGRLEAIVQPLASLLRRHAVSTEAHDRKTIQDVCRLLHVLVVVRGHKTVVKFFPHEAADLEKALQVLKLVNEGIQEPSSSSSTGSRSSLVDPCWEAQTVLLLWLSMLVLTPFDLRTVDSLASVEQGQERYTPLAANLLQLGMSYLDNPGPARDMAALLLARLVTRPDMTFALEDFLTWQTSALATSSGPSAVFLLPGVLTTLALIFKVGDRGRLLPYACRVWSQLQTMASGVWEGGQGFAGGDAAASGGAAAVGFAGNMLARKLGMKLGQRLGLLLLPGQQANWRYRRQEACLDITLAGTRTDSNTTAEAAGAAGCDPGGGAGAAGVSHHAAAAAGGGDGGDGVGSFEAASDITDKDGAELEDGYEVAEEVEGILGLLLCGISDKDTAVRWGAAKGVARIAGCLPCELAEEVVDQVVALFSPVETDAAWHGGCLTLAELARRSLLLPHRLPSLAPIIQSALQYDVRRGHHSIGAHVRDAAAYVCWAFARAYAPELLEGSVNVLASSLLTVACYDREVNCRRAAASAFQECVGRLGNFPHGIDILGVANYFSVGNVNSAYITVGPFVATFPEYTQPLLDHLLHTKLRHWEKPLRALAARALAALVPAAPQLLATEAVAVLLPLVINDALEVRAGAVIGLAELLPALAAAGVQLDPGQQQEQQQQSQHQEGQEHEQERELQQGHAHQVARVVVVLEDGRFYRGKGGEVMREVAARFVEQVSNAVHPTGASVRGGCSRKQLQGEHGSQATASSSSNGEAASTSDHSSDYAKGRQQRHQQQQGQMQEHVQHQLKLPLDRVYHAAALGLIRDCLGQPLEGARTAGVAALKAYARAHCTEAWPREQLLQLVCSCCERLRSGNVDHRRGAAAALAVLPAELIAGQEAAILGQLCLATQPEASAEARDVESRMLAVASLGQLCQEIYKTSPTSSSITDLARPMPPTAATATVSSPAATATTLPDAAATAAASHTNHPTGGTCGTSRAGTVGATQKWDLLGHYVLPVVLTGLHDYETDNRGDVGSWVRGAAMVASVQLLQLLVAHYSCAKQPQQQQTDHHPWVHGLPACIHLVESQQQWLADWQASAVEWCQQHGLLSPAAAIGAATGVALGDTAVAAGVAEATAEELTGQGGAPATTAPGAAVTTTTTSGGGSNGTAATAAGGDAGDGGGGGGEEDSDVVRAAVAGVSLTDMAVAVVGGLLQQGLGRIARLRESAIHLLQELVDDEQTAAAIPGARLLAKALPTNAEDIISITSLAAFPCLGSLLSPLPLSCYRPYLVEALVTSIGAVDASLGTAASSALLSQLSQGLVPQGQQQQQEAVGGLRMHVAHIILQIWQKAPSSSRLSLPLIKASMLLLTIGDFERIPLPCLSSTIASAATSTVQQATVKEMSAEAVAGAATGVATGGAAGVPTVAAAGAVAGTPTATATGAAAGGTTGAAAVAGAGAIAGARGVTGLATAAAAAAGAADKASGAVSELPASFSDGVLSCLKGDLRGCSDVPRLLEGASLAVQLCNIEETSDKALQVALVLLVNRYPKVRRHTAEQLYLSLLALEAEQQEEDTEPHSPQPGLPRQQQERSVCTWLSLSAEMIGQALDCLLISTWDGSLGDAKAARNALAALLGVEVKSVVVVRGGGQAACGAGSGKMATGEYASYQSLLNDAARGGGY